MNSPKPKPLRHLPNGMPVWGENAQGVPVCFKRRKSGGHCMNTFLNPHNGRCGTPGHGGRKGKSGGAPILNGIRSKALTSVELAEKVAIAEQDPKIASHEANIALLEGIIQQTLEGVRAPVDFWQSAIGLHGRAQNGDDRAMHELGELLAQGLSAESRVTAAVSLAEKQRRHKESEAKRRADIESNLTARQAQWLVTALIAAIENEDELTLVCRRRIQARLAGLLHRATD